MQAKLSKLQKEILKVVYNNHDSIETRVLHSKFKSYNSTNRAMNALIKRNLLDPYRMAKYLKEVSLTDEGIETAEELLLIDTAGFLIDGYHFKTMLQDITECKDYENTLIIIDEDGVVFIGCNGDYNNLKFGNMYSFYKIEDPFHLRCDGKASYLVETKFLRKYAPLIKKGKEKHNYFLEIRGTRLIIHEGDRHAYTHFSKFEEPDNPPFREKTSKKHKTKKANHKEKEYEPTADDWKV